jgi:hypothetical protein
MYISRSQAYHTIVHATGLSTILPDAMACNATDL